MAGMAGCVAPPVDAAAPGPPNPAARRCVQQAASYRLLDATSAKPVLRLRLNGRAVTMQVDTGAETSVLSRGGAALLGLAPGPARLQIAGLAGTEPHGQVRLAEISFGTIVTRDLPVPVIEAAGLAGLDGLVGADLLAPFAAEFDFAARRLTLSPRAGCTPAAMLPWRNRARALPLVTVTLNGRAMTGLIDTGASYSAISQPAAAVLGVPGTLLTRDRRVQSYGASNVAMPGRAHRFATLAVGAWRALAPLLRVVPLDPTLGVDVIIGMDLLANTRVWLDYPRRTVLIRDNHPGS